MRRRFIIKRFLVLIIAMVLLLSSCSRTAKNNHNICHLVTADIELPSGWNGGGNTTRFYTNDNYPDTYVLVGETSDPEEDIKKNLELFLSTEFYRNKIEFCFDESDELVSGILKNNRLEEEYYFYGCFVEDPAVYVFCMCKSEESKSEIKAIRDYAYESFI